MNNKQVIPVQMGLHVSRTFREISDSYDFFETLVNAVDNSIDAAAKKIWVILITDRSGITSLRVVDDGIGIFPGGKGEDVDRISMISRGDIDEDLKGCHPADLLKFSTSGLSFQYIAEFPAASIKSSSRYDEILAIYRDLAGVEPAGRIGAKAVGLLTTIYKCNQVSLSSIPVVDLARIHMDNPSIKQSDVPISELYLPSAVAVDANDRSGRIFVSQRTKLEHPLPWINLAHGTILTLDGILPAFNWYLSPERIAAYLANAFSRYLMESSIDLQFWTVTPQTKIGARGVDRRQISLVRRVYRGEQLVDEVIQTRDKYTIGIDIRVCGDESAEPVLFVRANSNKFGDPLGSMDMFKGTAFTDSHLTGTVEIEAPTPQEDVRAWTQDKKRPNISHPPMERCLQAILALQPAVSDALAYRAAQAREQGLEHMGEITSASIRQALAMDTELMAMLNLPPLPKEKETRRSKKRTKPAQRGHTRLNGVQVRLLDSQHGGIALPNDTGILVRLEKFESGHRSILAQEIPYNGYVFFRDLSPGRYYVEIDLPEGMKVIASSKRDAIIIGQETPGVTLVYTIQTNLRARATRNPRIQVQYRTDLPGGLLAHAPNFMEEGVVYINANAPTFRAAFERGDNVALSEAVAYPAITTIFLECFGRLDATLNSDALEMAHWLAADLRRRFKKKG